MEKITLKTDGLKFDAAFKTVVTKVTNPDEDSSITLDALPNLSISLNGQSATALKIEKDVQVTISPVEASSDGSFTLEVGEKVQKPAAKPQTRSSSPARSLVGHTNNF